MLEKIGHIKNPLTVIAMFAGIAEVSGTIVLPFIDLSIQEQYVTFLMGFPCLLVALFFITLWCKHFVLYAPSDFKEDKNFMDAHFKRGSSYLPVSDVEIYTQDLATSSIDQETKDFTGNYEACDAEEAVVGEPQKEKSQKSDEINIIVESSDEPVSLTGSNVVAEHAQEIPRNKKSIDLTTMGRKRVVSNLAYKRGGRFQVNVEPKQLPNIKFDAVIESSTICVVGFVDVSADSSALGRKIKKKFSDAKKFWETLSGVDKNRFVFHLALMFGPGSEKNAEVSFNDLVSERAELPFKTEVTLYEFDTRSMNTYAI